MPVAPGGDQHPVPRLGTIISQRLAAKRGERAARFVHQKVSRRKVPVVTVAARNGGVEGALRDPGKPQRQRGNARHDVGRRLDAGSFSRKFFGPAMRMPHEFPSRETEIAAPLQVAPPPATAAKNSPLTGANRQPATGRPLSTRAAETTHSGRPAM